MEKASVQYRAPTLVVEARVNGSQPLRFAFDTGSTTCLIDVKVARRLGIEPIRRRGREGPGFARARTLALGRAEARDLELVIRDLAPLSKRLGTDLAGILGFTWMEQFVFEIDYRAGRLTLWPRTAELIPTADQLPVPLELRTAPGLTGARLFVPATLEGLHRCPMEIDTGTDTGVLGQSLLARLGVNLAPPGGAEGAASPTHVVRRLELAGRVFANVRFRVAPSRGADAGPYGQCRIGNEQLKEFIVTLDIPRRRAFFRRLP